MQERLMDAGWMGGRGSSKPWLLGFLQLLRGLVTLLLHVDAPRALQLLPALQSGPAL